MVTSPNLSFLNLPYLVRSASVALLILSTFSAPTASEAQPVPCTGGVAAGFPCSNVDLLAHLPPTVFGAGLANDIWGWTDTQTGSEYAILGLEGGVAFVDLSDPTNPIYVGMLSKPGDDNIQTDMKVYADHLFVVSEAPNHGLEVFDLTRLRNVASPPAAFTADANASFFGEAHNLALNENSAMAYAADAPGACEGLLAIDIQVPLLPVLSGCHEADGTSHDAQCVTYHGDDVAHTGKDICFASNNAPFLESLNIVDMTNPASAVGLSNTPYPGSSFAHQAWLTEDHNFLLMNDEGDEQPSALHPAQNTRTYSWDVRDLDNPIFLGFHEHDTASIDHNLFISGQYVYEANYRAGLRILNYSNAALPDLLEVAYFDTYPPDDDRVFTSLWGVYPYFASGVVVISDVQEGLFVLQPNLDTDGDMDGVVDVLDNCTMVANPNQVDSDDDGYGNQCDADIALDGTMMNDGFVLGDDIIAIFACFGAAPPLTSECENADIKGNVGTGELDGFVLGNDVIEAFDNFGNPPGPSGLSCRGEIPCVAP